MTDSPKVPERIYIDPTNMKAGYWWTDGEEGEIEYLSPEAVEKELREFVKWSYDYQMAIFFPTCNDQDDQTVVDAFLARRKNL